MWVFAEAANPPKDVTIYDIQTGQVTLGDSVSVRDVIITGIDTSPSTYGFWAEQPGGGIYSGILCYTGSAFPTGLAVGDSMRVTGVYAEYGGADTSSALSEINSYYSWYWEKLGSNATVPAPTLLSCRDLGIISTDAPRCERWEGVLVKLDTLVCKSYDPEYPQSSWWVREAHNHPPSTSNDSVYVRTNKIPPIYPPRPDIGDTLISITGLYHYESSRYQICPRNGDDIVEKTEERTWNCTLHDQHELLLELETAVLGGNGTPLTQEQRDKVQQMLEDQEDALEKLKAGVENGILKTEQEANNEPDPKKKERLLEQIAHLDSVAVTIQHTVNMIKFARDNIGTLTKEAAELAAKVTVNMLQIVQALLDTLVGAAKSVIEGALEVAKTVIETAFRFVSTFLDGVASLLRSLGGLLRDFFGIFGLSCSTNPWDDGYHTLTMVGPGVLQITLPTISEIPQYVPLASLTFIVFSEPTDPETPHLRKLTITSFSAMLEPFTVEGVDVSSSTLLIPPDIVCVGVYDSTDQVLEMPLGGTIANSHTTCDSLMIFSTIGEGPIGVDGGIPTEDMAVVGRSLDPCLPAPVLALVHSTSDTTIVVVFPTKLDQTTAENTNNYSLGSETAITLATLDPVGEQIVTLTTATQVPGTYEILTACCIKGKGVDGRLMPESQDYSFRSGLCPISYVQTPKSGLNDSSQYSGDEATIAGIVTGDKDAFTTQFYMENTPGGPWSGIQVYGGIPTPVAEGDSIIVAGFVSEYYNKTEITSVDYLRVVSSGNPIPGPNLVAPNQISTGSPTAESYEGVFVRCDPVVVADTTGFEAFWEWNVADIDAHTVKVGHGGNYTFFPHIGRWMNIRGPMDFVCGNFRLEPRRDTDIDTVEVIGVEPGTLPKPQVFALEQNSPNPFNPVTNIFFSIPERAEVELYVCDVSGRVVKKLVDGVRMEPGRHEATWDGRNDAGKVVSSGVYFCKLLAADKVAQMKMVILK
jgi:hypothetical protein